MILSVLLYVLMASTLVALVGVLVVDAVRGVMRWRAVRADRHPAAGSAPARWLARIRRGRSQVSAQRHASHAP